ncbi:hypothetical protein D9M68_774610 [compost metagenome]
MGQDDGALAAERLGNDQAFLVRDRHARPFAQEGAVVMQRRHVHLGDHQRLAGRGQRGRPWRMGVDDGVHVRPRLIDPQVKARGRIGHALSRQRMQVAVHFDEVRRRGLVEAQAEPQRPVGAWPLRTHADLSGQAGLLLGHGQNAAGVGHGVLDAARHGVQMARHFLRGACIEVGFLS